MNRRTFFKVPIGAALASSFPMPSPAQTPKDTLPTAKPFSFNYVLSSSMYGKLPLEEVMKQLEPTGSSSIDIWPKVHANHREQIESLGYDAIDNLLEKFNSHIGVVTRYDLGPRRLEQEFDFMQRFKIPNIVCGGAGPKGLRGGELKSAVFEFVQSIEKTLKQAKDLNITICIENHSNNLINSPDSLRWLIERAQKLKWPIKVAFAPYHLESFGLNAIQMAELVGNLENNIAIFYAWQYGMGCHKKLPKEQELLQLPGQGGFNFKPVVEQLKRFQFNGLTSIFMHPVPRGIPILPSAKESTQEILKSKIYLDQLALNSPA